MTDLLIHSMTEFSEIILPALALAGASTIVEIGAEFGGMSAMLAEHCRSAGGRLISVDPAPKPEFLAWLAGRRDVEHVAEPSLNALPLLRNVDAWIIDGDHNWYTVSRELDLIKEACERDGRPVLAFLHDVGWPTGRRDMYYAPDRIPERYRHLHDMEAGAVPGANGLCSGRGFRGMGQFALAGHEGGARNGVLCAVEDFLEAQLTQGRELGFAEIPGVFGLGVVFDLQAHWSATLAELLLPYHQNKLLAALECNRLANWLTVLDFQDGVG